MILQDSALRGHAAPWRGAAPASSLTAAFAAALAAVLLWALWASPAAAIEYMGVTRDSFPVFDNPPMLSAQEAERRRLVTPRMAVIGVAHGGEAKAYPIAIMGIHELGNDTIGGIPIAVSW